MVSAASEQSEEIQPMSGTPTNLNYPGSFSQWMSSTSVRGGNNDFTGGTTSGNITTYTGSGIWEGYTLQ